MKENIYRISLGIRHRRSFRLPEIAGSIIDYIIYDPASPFPHDFFQASDAIVDNFENQGRILIGKDEVSSIVVDKDNLVVNLEAKNFDDDINKIKEKTVPFVKRIFKQFDIKNINRVGIVFEFKDTNEQKINKITDSFTASTFPNTDQLVFRFSEKDPDLVTLVKKELLDYINKIVIITKNKKGVSVKFDYQFYYKPEISSINDIDFDKFIGIACQKLDAKLFNWYK